MPFDFTALLSNPDFLQGLGQAGASLSSGDPLGVALNPAELIAQIQKRKATEQLLSRIFGSGGAIDETGAAGPVSGGGGGVFVDGAGGSYYDPNGRVPGNTTEGMTSATTITDALGNPVPLQPIPNYTPNPNGMSMMPKSQEQDLTPTPLGQAGPNSITTTTKKTADGTKTTKVIDEPSAANLSTFGTSVPPESVPATGKVGSPLPFFQALLG